MKLLGVVVMFVGISVSGLAFAPAAPEIDAGSAGSALALLTGALLVSRGHRKK